MTPLISVVIPTLGGPSLEPTIAALNAGTVVPAEIVICVPQREATGLRAFAAPNVRVLATTTRGQVPQRAEGFAHAAHPFVLQLDDDLIVAPDCVARLVASLARFEHNTAVSPALVDAATGESVYRMARRRPFVDRLNAWLAGGAPTPGRILGSGGAVGVDAVRGEREYYDVDWLPGGCILHHRENLVMENFFPFPGKAFCEDIIHSHHLTQRGVRLVIDARARVAVDVPSPAVPFREFRRELVADLRARRYFLTLTGRGPARVWRFAIARCLGYFWARRNSKGTV